MFSISGYDAVSIRMIAGVVGIKESSVYNHFENKQDILDTIIVEILKPASQYNNIYLKRD